MNRTGTLTFGHPGCLCCVYTAEPCSWDLGSVGLCSHSKKLTPDELRSGKLTLPTSLSGGLHTVEVSQWRGHWFPSQLDLAGPSPRLAPLDESCVSHPGYSWWQGLGILQAPPGIGCFPARVPIERCPPGNQGTNSWLLSRISKLHIPSKHSFILISSLGFNISRTCHYQQLFYSTCFSAPLPMQK